MATPISIERPAASGTPAAPRKLASVQGLRAIAALLVVWTHSIDAASAYSSTYQSRFFHLAGFGACGLDIFFVISGFIVSLVAARAVEKKEQSAGQFLSRRFTRIYPLYWILTAVIIVVAEMGRYPIQWHRVPWLPTVLLLPGWHYPVPSLILSLGWSLLFEIYFYLVLALWMTMTPRHLVRNTSLFLAAMIAVGAAVDLHRPLLVIWSNPVAMEFIFGCMIGQVYARFGSPSAEVWLNPRPSRRGWISRCGAWFTAFGAISLIASIFTGYGIASEASSIMAGQSSWLRVGVWGVPSGIFVLGAVLWNPSMQSFLGKVLVFLGDASYSIYLGTIPARSVVEHYWHQVSYLGGDVGIVLCGLVCVVFGVVCYLVLERPMMRYFHNWYKQIPFRAAEKQAHPDDRNSATPHLNAPGQRSPM